VNFREYVDHGWAICAIPRGKKGPDYDGWPTKPIPADAAEGLDGAGLLHALSGTCCLDIDQLDTARAWLAERGVDVDALLKAPDAVRISSGTPNRGKLLYRMKRPMRTFKPKASGIELRCASATGTSMQDVLPGSVHPSGRKYEWLFNDPLLDDWSSLPPIPTNLLQLWRELTANDPSIQSPQLRATPLDTPVEKVRKAIYLWIETQKKNVADYDDWIEVGQRLNDQTGGAEEGLDLWDEWSATDKSLRDDGTPRYKGRDNLLVHWTSFGKSGGAQRTMAAALNMLPAEADEFPIIEPTTEQPPDTATQAEDKKKEKLKRKEAVAALEKRLVFVEDAERYFDTQRHRIVLSENGVKHLFTSMMPRRSSGERMNPIAVLMDSATKTVVKAVAFHPGQGVIFKDGDEHYANRYWNRQPTPLEPTKAEVDRIEWLFNRIDDEAYRSWLMQFYAHVVQHPGTKIRSAPLIWSETEGNGKTTLMKAVPALLVESRYSKEVTYDALMGQFNDYMLEGWHINLTEFRAGTRNERSTIKQKIKWMIAETEINVRAMYTPGITLPNRCFVTASSNEEDAAQVDNEDRRWAIHELHAPSMTEAQTEYIYDQFLLTPRAAAVLRWYFQHYPITDFSPHAKAPMTRAKKEMIEASMPADKEWLVYSWEQQSDPLDRDVVITNEVMSYLHKHTHTKPSANRIGKLLTKKPFNGNAIQFRVEARNYRAVVLRNFQKWSSAQGKDILDHIRGNDQDLTL
jgi:hypothetical protein